MGLLPQSKLQILPLQGEEHGHCSLKVMLARDFFFFFLFLSSVQVAKNYWVTCS